MSWPMLLLGPFQPLSLAAERQSKWSICIPLSPFFQPQKSGLYLLLTHDALERDARDRDALRDALARIYETHWKDDPCYEVVQCYSTTQSISLRPFVYCRTRVRCTSFSVSPICPTVAENHDYVRIRSHLFFRNLLLREPSIICFRFSASKELSLSLLDEWDLCMLQLLLSVFEN